MAPFTKSYILPVLITMVVAMLKGGEARLTLNSSLIIPLKVTVQIINNFADPPQDLTLHCKSKDDDLGEHTIKVGEQYEFRFRPNVARVITLFFCCFRWPSDTSLHYFDIYVQERDENNCLESDISVCSWKIWKGGACKYDADVQSYAQCYPWNPMTLAPLAIAASITNTSHP